MLSSSPGLALESGFHPCKNTQVHACGKVLSLRGNHYSSSGSLLVDLVYHQWKLIPECLGHCVELSWSTQLYMCDVALYRNTHCLQIVEVYHGHEDSG